MFRREINPSKTKSFFLFGPRQTGKSILVKSLLTLGDLYIDLLPQRSFLNYAKTPGRVREEIVAHMETHKDPLCVIDEIQKILSLLDEVHELIESRGGKPHQMGHRDQSFATDLYGDIVRPQELYEG